MSTSSTRKGRRGRWALVGLLAACVGVFLSVGAGSASAAASCSFVSGPPGILTVTITDAIAPASNDIVFVRSGENILVGINGAAPAACFDGATAIQATALNTDQINVIPGPVSDGTSAAGGNDTVTIDQRQGRFMPGSLPEAIPFGLPEIEFYLDLGDGENELIVYGVDPAADGVTAGEDVANTFYDGIGTPAGPVPGDLLINLNAGLLTDSDADVLVKRNPTALSPVVPDLSPGASLATATFNLGGGDNVFSAKGGDGTGDTPVGSYCVFDVGVGPDVITPLLALCSTPPVGSEGILQGPLGLTITSGAGDDDITGGLGSDFINPGTGNDFVDGNGPTVGDFFCFQDDILAEYTFDQAGSTGDVVDLSGITTDVTVVVNEDGTITITGSTTVIIGIEGIITGSGNDTLTGNSASNLLGGGAGNDTISGLGGSDVLLGGDGDDTLLGGLGNDCVIGGAGNDTLDENAPVDANGVPTYGPLGNGADALDGGPGVDTVDYGARTNSTVVYLGLISTFNDGADTNQDGLTNEFDDVFFTTENVVTGSGEDLVSANFTNNRANNEITDNAGNDCVEGGPGNDTFHQGTTPQGADVILGNTGADWADYSGRTDAVAVSLDGVANDGDIATNEGDMVGGFSVSCRPATVVVNPPIGIFTDLFGDDFILNDLNFLDAPIPGPAPNCFAVEFDILPPCPWFGRRRASVSTSSAIRVSRSVGMLRLCPTLTWRTSTAARATTSSSVTTPGTSSTATAATTRSVVTPRPTS